MRYFLAALVLGTVPCALSAQSPADTVVARSIYWTDPLPDLPGRVSALVPEGFGAREVERIERDALGLDLTRVTWTGEELRAWSRRANHEPHIEIPRGVTTDPRCETSD